MSLDDAIAERVAERLDLRGLEDRIVARVVAELRAEDEWLSQAEFARRKGWSVDTVARKIAAGELEVQEFGVVELKKGDGTPVLNKNGGRRIRRSLRVRLRRRPTDGEIAVIAAQARAGS
jgi:hypothetical protein